MPVSARKAHYSLYFTVYLPVKEYTRAMNYLSVSEFARQKNLSERTVRHYCAEGKIRGAFLTGKTWNIPENATLPETGSRKVSNDLLRQLKEQKDMQLKGGIYHRTQIDLTYNSNRIEGSTLSHDQTRYIFETNTIGFSDESLNVDDIIETTNHFRGIDRIIDKAKARLTESLIKELHFLLKSGTSDSRKDWFNVGAYKKIPNEVGGNETCPPKEVAARMKALLSDYHAIKNKSFEDILDFHYRFEIIHPFQDGNGRVGRLILFKECLANNIVPFIIQEDLKMFYYRGLQEWPRVREYLTDTCRTAQDRYREVLRYFEVGG